MALLKTVIDCSKPIGHPDREKIVEIVGAEKDMLLAASAATEAEKQAKADAVADLNAKVEKIQAGIEELQSKESLSPVEEALLETLKNGHADVSAKISEILPQAVQNEGDKLPS